jgi:hypothetical protein
MKKGERLTIELSVSRGSASVPKPRLADRAGRN